MDKGVGNGKEWLDGPCDLNTSIQELLDLRDKGRAVRKSKAEERIRNEGRRRVRFGSGLMKPAPSLDSLRRSIAPGSYDSWSSEKHDKLGRQLDRQYREQSVERESSSKTMDDKEVAKYVRVGKETDEYARRTAGDSRLPPRGTPLRSKKEHGSSSSDRENFRRKISRPPPDGNHQYKQVGYQ
jgi:hypothetical protein